MADPEKAVVRFPPRDRVVITENDLETNFGLIKEVALGCFEQVLHRSNPSDAKEIPNLSEFEARVPTWVQIPRVTTLNNIGRQ